MSSESKCKIICVLGGPGAGKTTHTSKLSGKIPNSIALKSGSILKHALNKGSVDHSDTISFVMERGGLVSDELANKIVLDKISEVAADTNIHLIVLDGFPRTVRQLEALNSLKSAIIAGIIILEAPESILEKRCMIRNLKTDRVDDLQQPVEERIQDFRRHSKEILDFIKKHKIHHISLNTNGNLDDTSANSIGFAINLHL